MVKVALAVAVPRLWDSLQRSKWSHFHTVLSWCGQPFLLEMVNLKGKGPCRLTAFSKFITASQKVWCQRLSRFPSSHHGSHLEVSCFRNGPTVGPVIRWGLSQEEASSFVQAGENSVLIVCKFCTQPASLIVIATSLCKNQRLVLSVLPSPERKSLSDLNLQGF